MGNLSTPLQAPRSPSRLDFAGGLSLKLRGVLFVCVCILASRPDRWMRPNVSLHDAFLWLFAANIAYIFVGELVIASLLIISPVILLAAFVSILLFDRATYVPIFRFFRFRHGLPGAAAFSLAFCIEIAIASCLFVYARPQLTAFLSSFFHHHGTLH